VDDVKLKDIEADNEETELEEESLDWPRYAEWHLSRYPEDLDLIENINDVYRFYLDEYEQNAFLSMW